MRIARLLPTYWLPLCLIAGALLGHANAQDAPTAVFQPAPRPLPSAVLVAGELRLELYFSSLRQGGLGLLRLIGADIADARLYFDKAETPLFAAADGARYALVMAGMDAAPGDYSLTVTLERAGGAVTLQRRVRVERADYLLQAVTTEGLSPALVNPAAEARESDRLREIFADAHSAPLWDAAGFALPLPGPLTSPFGAFRQWNASYRSRHTGWDQNAPEGTPVRAMAAGRVAFAAPLELRGLAVYLDHGYGVFSGYAHLSQLLVAPGQPVDAGQIIGLSGNSGRSSAPHLHWEISLGGRWLDGAALLDLWLPLPIGAEQE